MADAEKHCRICKRSKPLSLFVHQRFPHRVTASCLDCRTGRPRTTLTPSQPPSQPPPLSPGANLTAALPAPTALVLPAPAPVSETSLPAPPSLPAAPSHNFVTRSDFLAGIGELRQALQDKIATTFQSVVSVPSPTHLPTIDHPPAPRALNPAQHEPALPARIGEYQPAVVYPWLASDLIDKVLQDTLNVYDLPKLANPSWPGIVTVEEPVPVLIEGFSVVKGPTSSASNRQFLKAVPNFLTFGRLWVVYLSLRSSTSLDRDLPVSLGRFFQHIADLSEVFPWE